MSLKGTSLVGNDALCLSSCSCPHLLGCLRPKNHSEAWGISVNPHTLCTAEPKDGVYVGPEDGVWFVRAVLEIAGLLWKRESKQDRFVEWVGFMNGGLSGVRALAIPWSPLTEVFLLQVILLVLLHFVPYIFFIFPGSPLPCKKKNTVQLDYLYNSALRPHCQRLFNLLVPILLSTSFLKNHQKFS